MMSYESPYQALKESGIRNLVNEFYNFIKLNSLFNLSLIEKNIVEAKKNNPNILEEFLHGIELKSYEFNKYK